jgi:3-isopropylmalate/(R)-2-methylmalate dehydratase small subunit
MSDFEWVMRGRCHKFGDDVPHADGILPAHFITARETDPEILRPHLFEELRPGFSKICRPGDIVVAGKRFGMGPKVPGYIAMRAHGLGLDCESMPVQAYRAALGEGLPVLAPNPNVLELCDDGDLLEIDFSTGLFSNETRGAVTRLEPVPEALRDLIIQGGTAGWLSHWWQEKHKPVQA